MPAHDTSSDEFPDESLVEILNETETGHPASVAFAEKISASNRSRSELIDEAQHLSGVKILDTGTFNEYEIGEALRTVVAWKLNGNEAGRKFEGIDTTSKRLMPLDTKYLVLGHGFGTGENWTLVGTGKVQDYVNKNVPQGEEAWVVACTRDESRNLALLSGEPVISKGIHANVNAQPGGKPRY